MIRNRRSQHGASMSSSMNCTSVSSDCHFHSSLSSCSQDTNSMQYRLMLQLAAIHRCVSVVGDPDQSSERLLRRSVHYAHRIKFTDGEQGEV